jgi:mannose-6-phosphate isomerase class I
MLYKVCFEHFFEFFRCNGESQSLRFNLSQEILKVGTPENALNFRPNCGENVQMYDKFPCVDSGSPDQCITGWEAIMEAISSQLGSGQRACFECYPGVFVDEIASAIAEYFPTAQVLQTATLLREPEDINAELDVLLSEDPVFGWMTDLVIEHYFDSDKLTAARKRVSESSAPLVIVIGVGASLLSDTFDLTCYADMPRWEIQMRQRLGQIGNLGADNLSERPSLKYKRAFFADWRAADRLKTDLHKRINWILDTVVPASPKAIWGAVYRSALARAANRPFRVVPFFDPGPWGGHWMERVCDLPDDGSPNHAWCFDCVPEENSLLLGFGDKRFELPALNLILAQPLELLGERVYRQFGAEFPIRFDFLDTMGGGNLSLQVHPLTEYIRRYFGMAYTQDESYYLLDAAPDAVVYLGLKEGIAPTDMLRDLSEAQSHGNLFPIEQYVNIVPARKHDHFLIPAGTVHCSGKNSMVLEISATPYIFTFKLWDWGRVGLDGRFRPIHLQHGAENIQWQRTTSWVMRNLVNQVDPLREGEGWRAERTGLHALEFIETVRHWFSVPVHHDTDGTVHVLNLVEGEEALVYSPTEAFAPFVVHYAETFIVPAAVGEYSIRPHGPSVGKQCATMQAFVRPDTDGMEDLCR